MRSYNNLPSLMRSVYSQLSDDYVQNEYEVQLDEVFENSMVLTRAVLSALDIYQKVNQHKNQMRLDFAISALELDLTELHRRTAEPFYGNVAKELREKLL